MKLSGELDYRIRYDVEHDLFHAQNVFNDEYITPTFIEYVQKLEKENAELKGINTHTLSQLNLDNGELITKLTKAKEIIRDFLSVAIDYIDREDKNYSFITEAEQFLKDQEEEPCGQ